MLSAYIDQQLPAAERQALERRLEQEPALQRELEELQTTVALLRDLPALELPRSFTLDPATAPKRRSFWQQLLPFGGGLVGVALVMLIGLTVLGSPVSTEFQAVSSGLSSEYEADDNAHAETAPLIQATEGLFEDEAAAGEMAAEEAPETAAGEMAAEEAPTAAIVGEMPAGEEAATEADQSVGAQPPEAAMPAAPQTAADDEVTAADAPPAARQGESAGDTGGTAPPALQASPPLLATSQSTSPDTLDLPADESPAAAEPAATPPSPLLPALLGAGIAAAGILIGLWLARRRRSR